MPKAILWADIWHKIRSLGLATKIRPTQTFYNSRTSDVIQGMCLALSESDSISACSYSKEVASFHQMSREVVHKLEELKMQGYFS